MLVCELNGLKYTLDQIIAMRLKELREMLGISQQALSEATNISIKLIQKYENALTPISSSELYFFAKLLKAPVSYFMSDVPFENYNADYSFDHKNEDMMHMVAEDKSEYIMPMLIDNIPSELTQEVSALVKVFVAIQNSLVRQRIIDLTKAISG